MSVATPPSDVQKGQQLRKALQLCCFAYIVPVVIYVINAARQKK
jgi:hypothetical protein